jgi:hypothetical protein
VPKSTLDVAVLNCTAFVNAPLIGPKSAVSKISLTGNIVLIFKNCPIAVTSISGLLEVDPGAAIPCKDIS